MSTSEVTAGTAGAARTRGRANGRATALFGAALALAAFLAAAPASAASGQAYTSDTGDTAGHTYFDDRINVYTVYDDDKDDEGVVGWIQIRRVDGTWRTTEHVYVGTGAGTSRSGYVDIAREQATVKIWACRQNGSGGTPYSCGTATVAG